MTDPSPGRPDRTTFDGAHEGRGVPASATRWGRLPAGLPWWFAPAVPPAMPAADRLERIALGAYLVMMCRPEEDEILQALQAGATLEQVAAALGPFASTPAAMRVTCRDHILSYHRGSPDLIPADAARAALALLGEELPADLEDSTDG